MTRPETPPVADSLAILALVVGMLAGAMITLWAARWGCNG
jgi:hypothetical protein